MKWINRAGKWLAIGAVITAMGVAGAGCQNHSAGTQLPTGTQFPTVITVSQEQVDKIDLLFMIDNSSSMADKQAILSEAVPQLLNGLLQPACVDKDTGAPVSSGPKTADPTASAADNYGCTTNNSEPEFKPVTDMHIGIVTSSLGTFGSDICDTSSLVTHPNDHAHLLARVPAGSAFNPGSTNFLAWFPAAGQDPDRHPAPPASAFKETDAATLKSNFQDLVTGVGQDGCGLEAQLESVYRFLIQPDPWLNVNGPSATSNDPASLEGVDQTVLQQRADFLRPDSLVAVIMLTDEDDSFADPLSFLGRGWKFAYRSPLWRPTSACATDPASPDCMSCADTRAAFGSTCQSNPLYTTSEDDPNVRFFHMKQRFGVDPQFPVQRYISGFTNSRVPDRNGEHVIGSDGVPGPYLGTATCTNPLFAAKLPSGTPGEDTCNLPLGARTADRVFFAVIGGVPNSLLPVDPTSSPTADDWVKILGADPANFNYDGISPYMIQSTTPRAGVPAPTGSETFGNNGNDPVVGRDYITNGTDLQYACTFDLPPTTPNPCADVNSLSCDCASTFFSPPVIPPLCSAQGVQTKAKAYPTIRPFQVVKALGNQGIIASLCPIQLTDNTRLDYGYNPAVASIVNRLKNALTQQCLPQQFTRDPQTNEVPCFVLAQLSEGETCDKYGLAPPSQDILSAFIEQQNAAGFDVSQAAVCQVPQSAVPAGDSCKDDTNINWCYVENTSTATPASNCAQALLFSAGSRDMAGARFVLQCTQ